MGKIMEFVRIVKPSARYFLVAWRARASNMFTALK